jgi:phenylacetate-CoA ligase
MRRLRYGGDFISYGHFLDRSQWWSEDEIEKYRFEKLEKLLYYCFHNVPYYRDLWIKINLKPSDIKTISDLKKLPVLKKEDVHANLDKMISDSYKKSRLIFCHTSGTTGKSIQFYERPQDIQFRWAVWWRYRNRFGIQFDSPYATFTGQVVIPIHQIKPPYWRYNAPMKQTIFTMHHIAPEKVRTIVDRLNRGDFVYYSGYPSIIFNLANLIIDQNLEITNPPRIIFTGAEKLFEDQRALISKVFDCLVTDQYGFSEGCGNASRCEKDVFHEDFEYGILECGDPEQIDHNTMRGKIIATGFSNYAMPFIRYEVGDVGIWKSIECECGRKSKVLVGIEGRCEDFIMTPEGTKIMRFDYIFKDTVNVREAQVVQKELGRIQIRIVKRPDYRISDEKYILSEIKSKISRKLKVDFEYVPEIEREKSGKFRAVKSLLKSTF